MGYRRGFLIEVLQTLGLFAAILLGLGLLDKANKYLVPFVGKNSFLPIASFIVVFAIAWFLLGKIAWWVSKEFKKTIFGSIDGAAGAAFGMLKAIIIMSSLLFVASLVNIKPPQKEIDGTFIYPVVKEAGPKATSLFSKIWPTMHSIAKDYLNKTRTPVSNP